MTGSADGFAKCWDLRAVRETASLGAHKGGVTDLRWFKGSDAPLSAPQSDAEAKDVTMTNGDSDAETPATSERLPKKAGTFLVTAGFDKAVNVFSADDWALCKSLTGHDGTVLATDVTREG
ncbi:hypothetical protein LTR53_019945, partial [Teratosphaeriaceae sp. CCFEE 6253]